MEIKVLIFIAILLISVISSIVKGLKKFNETRPGQGSPRPEREEVPEPERRIESLEDVFKEIEQSFNPKPAQPAYEKPVTPPQPVVEPVIATPRKEYEAKQSVIRSKYDDADRKYNDRAAEKELKARKRRITKERETEPVTELRESAENLTESAFDLPDSREDFRKMIVWSAILNRPYG